LKNSEPTILCIGEVLWDRLPSGSKPGGAPLNVAVHLKAIGYEVALASRIGSDNAGKDLLNFLNKSGVNTQFIQTDKNYPTSEVLVHLDENKNATYEICEPVAWDFVALNNELNQFAKKADVIVFGSLASRNKKTRETILQILENDGLKLMDVNFRPPFDKREVVETLLAKTNLVKLNDDELRVFAGWHEQNHLNENQLIEWLANYYKLQMVCVTKGENGALLYADNKIYAHPGFKIKTADTVGAGDAFLAGMVASILARKNPEEALSFACATGAFVASKKGATPKYDLKEIKRIQQQ
jgi:fructokinase